MPRGENQGLRYESTATDAELAWAAGLFEGEGSFSRTVARHIKHRRYLAMTVVSTDRDVLEKFNKIVKIGGLRGPYYTHTDSRDGQIKPRNKPLWHWGSGGFAAMQLATDPRFSSWLGERRRARLAELVIEFGDQGPLKHRRGEVCQRGHRWDEHGGTTKGRITYCKQCRKERLAEKKRNT